MHTTKLTVEPLLSFITKVTAARVAQSSQAVGGPAAKPLREQVGCCAGGRCAGAVQFHCIPLLAWARSPLPHMLLTRIPASPHPPTPLQAFAAPERVAELVGRVRQALATSLPAAVAKMRLYLTSPATHAILFKPIKSNVAEAHGQLAALLQDGQYSDEERAAIGLTPAPELAALLDGLLS